MWYFLDSPQEDGVVYLHGSYERIVKLFLSESTPTTEFNEIIFNACTESEKTSDALHKTDFLRNSRFGGIPIVSERFKSQMSKYLSSKIHFYPCQVTANQASYIFFLCQVKNVMPIIDYENSSYRVLTDGSQILDDPITIKTNIDEALLIVRDSQNPSIVVVSELFKEIVEQEGLNILFYRVDDSFW